MEKVLLVVLGAALALVTSLVMEKVRVNVQENRMRRLLTMLLRDELATIKETLNKTVSESRRLSYVPLIRIGEIIRARQGFDRNRDWVILYKDDTLRKDIFSLYQDLASLCGDAETLEALVNNKDVRSQIPDAEFFSHYNTKKQEIIQRFENFEMRIKHLTDSLKNAE